MRPVVLTVAGTRPEAIKVAPVVAALRADRELDAPLLVTGQHREILDQVLATFGLDADANLDILRPGQSLAALTARAIDALGPAIDRFAPDLLIVQGDTTTAFAAALAAFYARVPVAHVEAGLRTGDLGHPFPEEANRKLVSAIADVHFAPTDWSRDNLLAEGIAPGRIVVTGNTVVDALHHVLAAPFAARSAAARRALSAERLVVVTTHRRENWGEPQRAIARAVARVAALHPETTFLVPLHPNPAVRASLVPALEPAENVVLCEPLEYGEMVHAIARARCVLTDSGGIQEESCALGVPLLVLRETTERPEAVNAGVARLVGTDSARVVRELERELRSQRRPAGAGVFGDGRAALRIHDVVRRIVGLQEEEQEEVA